MRPADDVLAVIPAAGRGLRLGAAGTSKEVLPIDGRLTCQDLLEALDEAGIESGLLLTRRAKLDVPLAVAELPLRALRVATLLVPETPSVPHTLDRAWPFLRGRTVALGFPDVLLEPHTVFRSLLERHREHGADVVLALFPAIEPARSDLVAADANGGVSEVVVKSPDSPLRRTWMAAVWSPRFTEHLHRGVAAAAAHGSSELQLGHLVGSALREGLVVDSVDLPEGRVLDIGTPEALRRARGH